MEKLQLRQNCKRTHQNNSRYLTYPSSKKLFNATMDVECNPQPFERGVTITLFKGGNKDKLSQHNSYGYSAETL